MHMLVFFTLFLFSSVIFKKEYLTTLKKFCRNFLLNCTQNLKKKREKEERNTQKFSVFPTTILMQIEFFDNFAYYPNKKKSTKNMLLIIFVLSTFSS